MDQNVADKCASRLVDKAPFCFETTRIWGVLHDPYLSKKGWCK